jgi:hypothetical protein
MARRLLKRGAINAVLDEEIAMYANSGDLNDLGRGPEALVAVGDVATEGIGPKAQHGRTLPGCRRDPRDTVPLAPPGEFRHVEHGW